MRKFNIAVNCVAVNNNSGGGQQVSAAVAAIHGRPLVLRNDRVFVSSGPARWPATRGLTPEGYTLQAFYIEYPDDRREKNEEAPIGLVSQTADEPQPLLNWVYVDKATGELKYGNRSDSRDEVVGPWHWRDDEGGVTLDGWEGFMAVEVPGPGGEKAWQVYFDREDDGLKVLGRKRRKVEITLERVFVEEEKTE